MSKIKINKSLLSAIEINPSKNSVHMDIVDLNKKIKNGEISIPIYQRDLSWTEQQCVNLLNFLLKGSSSVSAISMLEQKESSNKVQQLHFISREEMNKDELNNVQLSVIDGQQRLSVTYMAYTSDKYLKDIYLDLGRGLFRLIDDDSTVKSNHVPVNILLNEDWNLLYDFYDKHTFDTYARKVVTQIQTKLINYTYTINKATNLDVKEQLEWFKILNNAGSNVTETQISLAYIYDRGIDIYVDYIRKYNTMISDCNIVFKNSRKTAQHNNSITALNIPMMKIMNKEYKVNFTPIPSDTKAGLLVKANNVQLKEAIEISLNSLKRTLDFIIDNKLTLPDRVEYINFILSYFILNEQLDETDYREYIIDWYNKVDFTDLTNTQRRNHFDRFIKNKGLEDS